MNQNNVTEQVQNFFLKWFGSKPEAIQKLPQTASYRQYYRIKSADTSYIVAYNETIEENIAFESFTNTFAKLGFNVPKLHRMHSSKTMYILDDLGDQTLFNILPLDRSGWKKNSTIVNYYKQALEQLLEFQIRAAKKINYKLCFPRSKFDKQSIIWDLNYFKYNFLKFAKIDFDEQLLETDFKYFSSYLTSFKSDFFMFRDFQSRNIMIKDNELYFIDYQGGRRGALQYDVASLLYDGKANIPNNIRKKLLDHYLSNLERNYKLSSKKFMEGYYAFVFIRILQALGAYGFRGLYENNVHLIKSIPLALDNLRYLYKNGKLNFDTPQLKKIVQQLIYSDSFEKFRDRKTSNTKFTVSINSFSYKKSLPVDLNDNGGGFVFDCRGIDNPGRISEFQFLTGKDIPVINYLEQNSNVKYFLDNIYSIVDLTVESYINRGFKNLMINFGCTGGQHRSVYCADKMFLHLKEKYDINVMLNHIEQNIKEEVIR